MKKLLFELLISPLSISDNYYLNFIIMALIGLVAFRIAFKVVGNLGFRGGIGSLFHWTIRFFVVVLLCSSCCIVISAVKFVIAHVVLLSIICIGCIVVYFLARNIYKHVFGR